MGKEQTVFMKCYKNQLTKIEKKGTRCLFIPNTKVDYGGIKDLKGDK